MIIAAYPWLVVQYAYCCMISMACGAVCLLLHGLHCLWCSIVLSCCGGNEEESRVHFRVGCISAEKPNLVHTDVSSPGQDLGWYRSPAYIAIPHSHTTGLELISSWPAVSS